jgi:hypothetical protein
MLSGPPGNGQRGLDFVFGLHLASQVPNSYCIGAIFVFNGKNVEEPIKTLGEIKYVSISSVSCKVLT